VSMRRLGHTRGLLAWPLRLAWLADTDPRGGAVEDLARQGASWVADIVRCLRSS
jgi:hypothetical protein